MLDNKLYFNQIVKLGIISAIKFYQKTISPILNRGYNRCRFYPSCSNYAIDAINKKGVCVGSFMALKRILRCNPWSHGGIDEV